MVIMAKKNIITTTITTEYSNTLYNLPIEVAQMVSRMIEPYKAEVKAETTKVEPKATESKPKAKTEPKKYDKVYTVSKDGKSVTIGNGGFIPTKVFKGVTYSLKQSGAKYNATTKAWDFDTKKSCTAWCKAQDARA